MDIEKMAKAWDCAEGVIEKMANADAYSDRDRRNRGKRVNQKGWVTLAEAKKDAAAKKGALTLIFLLLLAVVFVLVALIKGLFSKNKSIRILSALGLLAIGIGVTVFVGYQLTDHSLKARYLRMNEKAFKVECASFADLSKVGYVTPEVKTNLTSVLMFRDVLRRVGIADDAFKESYAAGGFEALCATTVMDAVMLTLCEPGKMERLADSLNQCVARFEVPDWMRQELRIRICLDSFISCSQSFLETTRDYSDDFAKAELVAFQAKEVQRILKLLGIESCGNSNSKKDMPSSSMECVAGILSEYECKGVIAKWIKELEKWSFACVVPDDVSDSFPVLISPGFPFDALGASRDVVDAVSVKRPVAIVRKDGTIKTIREVVSKRDMWGDPRNYSQIELQGIKYLTPKGVVVPFKTENTDDSKTSATVVDNDARSSFDKRIPLEEEITAGRTTQPTTVGMSSRFMEMPDSKSEDGFSSRFEKQSTVETESNKMPVATSSSKSVPAKQAVVHDWSQKCKEEWKKSFHAIQKVFSVFGGFVLAQPPIDGIEFKTEGIQEDVPLQKEYRYFKKADLKFYSGALVGFTLKAHFAKTYSRASIDREYKAFQDDVVKNLKRLHRPEFGVTVGTMPPWTVRYGELPSPSVHNLTGEVLTLTSMRQDEDGFDLTLSVEAGRDLKYFIDLALKEEADGTGVELEVFDKKQQSNGEGAFRNDASHASAVSPTNVVRITGYGSYRFGQKYAAARMTAEMWQEGGLAIKPVQVYYRKFRTLELGYAIDGKRLCRMRFCAEFQPDADENQLNGELTGIKAELERQYGFKMTQIGNEFRYEDENYVVKVWRQSVAKTVYNTRHVGARRQRIARTVNVNGLYLLLEDKRLMP